MGQGGETIANIRERSGARLQLEPEDRFAAERPLRIIGSEEQVKTARDMVIKLFEELDPAAAGVLAVSVRAMNSTDVISNLDQYRAQRREIPVPRAAVGRIIGRGGETIRRLQDSSGARIQFSDGTPRCRCVVACGVCVVVSPCPRFDGCAFACAPLRPALACPAQLPSPTLWRALARTSVAWTRPCVWVLALGADRVQPPTPRVTSADCAIPHAWLN